MGERKRLQPWISVEAHAAWFRLAKRHNVNVSALVDAIGRSLDDGTWTIPDEVVNDAQALERENLRRT